MKLKEGEWNIRGKCGLHLIKGWPQSTFIMEILCFDGWKQRVKKVDKLDLKWEGPFRVVRGFEGSAFKLETTEGDPIPQAWNMEHLYHFYVLYILSFLLMINLFDVMTVILVNHNNFSLAKTYV
jgi:hypothetical protein